MKHRKWVLVLFTLFFLGVAGGYITYRLAGIDEKFRQIILDEIAPYVDSSSDIGSVRIDLASLHVKDARLSAPDGTFSVDIDDLRLGYSLPNLLRHGFKPGRVAREILLIHPRLIIREMPATFKPDTLVGDINPFRHILHTFSGIRQITVSRGEILLEDTNQVRIRLAHGLRGRFLASPSDSASLRFSGQFFESEEDNLEMTGALDLIEGRAITVNAVLKESAPPETLPLFLPAFIRVASGRMRGEGRYVRGRGAAGFFELTDGRFALQESSFVFDDIALRADLTGRNIGIQGRIGDFNGSIFSLSGTVRNILNPALTIHAVCDSFDLATFFSRAAPDLRIPITGRAGFQFSLSGPPDSLVSAGKMASENIRISGIPFKHMGADVRIAGRLLTLQGQAVQEKGATLGLHSVFDLNNLKDPDVRMDVAMQGPYHPMLPSRIQKTVHAFDGALDIQVRGPLSNPSGRIEGNLILSSRDNRQIRLTPAVSYQDHRCQGEILSSDLVHVTGNAENILTHDYRWRMQIIHGENLLTYLTGAANQDWLEGVEASASLSGERQKWRFSLKTHRRRHPVKGPLFNLVAEANRTGVSPTGHLRATYHGTGPDSLQMTSEFRTDDRYLVVRNFNVEDLLTAELKYPVQEDDVITGGAVFRSLSLSRLHPFLSSLSPFAGLMDGRIQIEGTGAFPVISTRIGLTDGRIYGNGIFEGDFSGKWDTKGLRSLTCGLNRNDIPILAGQVDRTTGDTLSGGFGGSHVLLGPDQIRLSETGDLLQGSASFQVSVSGPSSDPVIDGAVSISQGALGPILFQDLKVGIRDASDSTGSRILSVRQGILRRTDGFVMTADGRIPRSAEGDTDLRIEARGNVLGPLSALVPIVRRSQGDGTLRLRLAGRPGAWVLGEGDLSLSSGNLELDVLVRSLTHLQGHIDLDRESRFLRIDSLIARVDGHRLRISNVPALDGFIPLSLDTLGLTLGILQVRMANRGIPVHIPRLMEPGDKGLIHLSGNSPGEPFLIAGPLPHPVFQGVLGLSNCRFTYPFLPVSGDRDSGPEMDVLTKIDWNVRVLPAKDVHYVRSIQSPLGNVFLDLKLRERHGDMNFQGIYDEDQFQVWGSLASGEGTIEAINQYFKPQQITFEYPKGVEDPILSGRAFTTVIDSMGMPSTVWLILTNLDATPGKEGQGGALDRIVFRFETDNPNLGRSEADILAALGYSESQIRDRAYDAIGLQVENRVFRPLFRPIENQLRRRLGLDLVRFSSMFSRNLMQFRTREDEDLPLDPKWLFRSTRLTLGKYLAPGFFLIYSGQLESDMGIQYRLHGIGIRHALTLEYSIRPDLFLEMEYTYDSQLLSDRREDKRIWLRHMFPF